MSKGNVSKLAIRPAPQRSDLCESAPRIDQHFAHLTFLEAVDGAHVGAVQTVGLQPGAHTGHAATLGFVYPARQMFGQRASLDIQLLSGGQQFADFLHGVLSITGGYFAQKRCCVGGAQSDDFVE
jgi:hypothetical protein